MQMIEANIVGLGRLFEEAYKRSGRQISGGKKFIATSNEEKEYVKHSKLKGFVRLMPNLTGIECEFRNNRYVAFWGKPIDETCIESELLLPLDVNAGLVTILLYKTSLTLATGINPLEFVNDLYSQHEQPKFTGYDYNDILKYLEPISLFKIPKDSIFFSADLMQIACYVILKTANCISLPFGKELLDSYESVVVNNDCLVSYENILQSLTCISWKHTFLEVYRCIERLFPMLYLKEVIRELSIAKTLLETATSLENAINWRPKEDEALKRLFGICGDSLKEQMEEMYLKLNPTIVNSSSECEGLVRGLGANEQNPLQYPPEATKITTESPTKSVNFCEKFALYVYSIRNSIVHFRSKHRELDLDGETWNSFLGLQLQIIRFLYEHFEDDLSPNNQAE